MVSVGLSPNRFGLRLYAGHSVENDETAIQHPERTLHLHGEIHMARSIDDVDLVLFPKTGSGSSSYGDASLPLLLHPIHHRGTLVYFTYLVGFSGVVEDTLRCGRLSRVDVGDYSYVTGPLKRYRPRHTASP
jgi:hypothetical protein